LAKFSRSAVEGKERFHQIPIVIAEENRQSEEFGQNLDGYLDLANELS
jgi:hypothetical protein